MIQRLSAGAEFCLVVGIAFAYSIVLSVLAALSKAPAPPIDTAGLVGLVLYECVLMAILVPILRARRWTFADLGLNGRGMDVVLGFGFAFAFHAINALLWWLASAFGLMQLQAQPVAISEGLGLPAVAALTLVNPLFEEIFVCGYVVRSLSRLRSPWFAINVSAAIRLSYHLYQGSPAVVGILPMGLLSAWWFARTGRLWPIIVAHAMLDFAALAPHV